jgi:hypothetical protein
MPSFLDGLSLMFGPDVSIPDSRRRIGLERDRLFEADQARLGCLRNFAQAFRARRLRADRHFAFDVELPLDARRARRTGDRRHERLAYQYPRYGYRRIRIFLKREGHALISSEGDMTEADLWALSKDALGLLDAFALERLTARYRPQNLDAIAAKLRGVTA